MVEIKFVDLSAEYYSIKDEIDKAIRETLESGSFVLGDQNKAFEKEFAKYIGTRYGVGLNSGTDGLFLSLKALGIGEGDEVITVANTYISTVDAIVRNRAVPVFVDIDPKTYNMDVELVEGAITSKTKAIIPVHLYGQPVQMERLMEIADKHDIFVVEDACQAHGASFNGKKVGSFGDVGVFSFYPTKNLGAYGDGGMVVTRDEAIRDRIAMLRNNGQTEKYRHDSLGINSRLDEMQASILRIKLKYLDEWNDRRRRGASEYRKLFDNTEIIAPYETSNGKHVYHLFVISHPSRQKILGELRKAGIPCLIHYPIPVHKQKYYLGLYRANALINTEAATERILSVPIHPFLEESSIELITSKIQEVIRQ